MFFGITFVLKVSKQPQRAVYYRQKRGKNNERDSREQKAEVFALQRHTP